MKPCTYETFTEGRLMRCTLPASHTDPARNTPAEREHVLWAAAEQQEDRD